MTIRTPAAAARFAPPSYERPVGLSGAPCALRFDTRLQGDDETVFLDV